MLLERRSDHWQHLLVAGAVAVRVGFAVVAVVVVVVVIVGLVFHL